MKKVLTFVFVVQLVVAAGWFGQVLEDRNDLKEEVIRLHVVANSDSEEDQTVKLQVKDAVIAHLQDELDTVSDPQQAKVYLQTQLPVLEQVAVRRLRELGSNDSVKVSLDLEAFPSREYDTFTLPSGVYESLRIVIGEGKGHNWWCVVFPALCYPDTREEFSDQAVAAGFSEELTHALTEEDGYEIRFLILEWLGKIENFLFEG